MQSSTLNNPAYTDFSGLNELRAQARIDPQSSLKQVAKQFEGIFIQMMLKSMRDASMGDAIFDSDQSKLYRDMFDKQVALDMANSKGIGIADSMVRQLSRHNMVKTDDENSEVQPEPAVLTSPSSLHRSHLNNGKVLPHSVIAPMKNESFVIKSSLNKSDFNSPEEFTQHILPYAEKAAKELGVSPLVLVSQAALETGWGKAITHHRDGSSSFNLFNIKADTRWDGDHVIKSTLEYSNGVAKHEKASFRSYDSYADSFDDYVDFLRTNSRYSDALRHQSIDANDQTFIKNLHKAGYATDPNYANKVIDILKRIPEAVS